VSLADRLTRLGELLVAMSGSPVPTHLFQTLADEAGGALPNDYVAVCLADSERGGYLVHSLAALPDRSALTPRVFAPDEGVPGRAMRRGQACVVDDLTRADAGADDLEGTLARSGLGSALVVPVRRGLEMLGALLFARRAGGAFTQDDVHIATLIASGLSAALETSRAYQALADERSTLAAVLGSSQDAVVAVNEEGTVVLANPAVRPLLGLAREAIGGQPFAQALAHGPLRELFAQRRLGISEVPLPDGRTAQVSVVAVTTPHGESLGLAAILRDITVQKQLEQMKNEFVGTVSHDLKNPITVIANTATLMRRAGPADERHDQRCARIEETARYMMTLVGDLLDLAKIQAGLEAPPEALDLVPLVEETLRMLGPQAAVKHIALSVSLPAAAPIAGHARRLEQAVINLVGNAIKYTPEGGAVSVAASLSPGGAANAVTLAVRDSGIGIPARDLPYVFDRFYRVESEGTATMAGTGLGLAIVKGIAEAHGGRVSVESVEGAGSTFCLELPLSPAR